MIQMDKGRQELGWIYLSTLLAGVFNCHRGSKNAKVFKPSDFNPFEQHGDDAIEFNDETAKDLKYFFTGER